MTWVLLSNSIKNNNDDMYSNAQYDSRDSISMLFVGDIMLGRNVEDNPFEYVDTLINSTDLSFGNLEYSITNSTNPVDKKYKEEKKTINLKADCDTSKRLKDVGFDVLSLANNHMMDFGQKGLSDTIKCLDGLNIRHTGAGRNISEAKMPIIINISDVKIGFLSYTSVSPSDAHAKNNKSGVAFMGRNIEGDVRDVKNQTDFLIVYIHWGNEFDMYPDDIQKDKGRKIIDAGADMVIGNHPHVVQPYERYKYKYIFYSLGNFVFDQEHEVTKSSMAIRIILDKRTKTVSVEKINLGIKDTKPYILSKETSK